MADGRSRQEQVGIPDFQPEAWNKVRANQNVGRGLTRRRATEAEVRVKGQGQGRGVPRVRVRTRCLG